MIDRTRCALFIWIAWAAATAWAAEPVPTLHPGADWPNLGGPTGDFKSPETGIRTDWSDGKLPTVWELELGEGYVPPTVADGRCFVFDRVGKTLRLRCVDAVTGALRWTFDYETEYRDMYGYDGGPRAAPVVDGDRVYIFGPAGVLHCVGVADGKARWKVDTAERFGVVQNFFGTGSTPIVEGDVLIVQVGGSPPDSQPVRSGRTEPNGTGVVGFDKMTGEVRYTVGDELASYACPMVVDLGGKRTGLMFARGGLLAFDPVAGEQRWHFPWRARIIESVNAANPVVVGDRVYLSECYGPGGVVLDASGDEPKIVWQDDRGLRAKAIAAHWATPIHHEGYLYGSSGRHEYSAELRCVDFKTGEVKWSQEGMGRCALILVDGRLVVLGERGKLSLVEATPERFNEITSVTPVDADGKPRLRYPAWAAPVLSRGLLYVRGDGRLLCMELIPRIPRPAPEPNP